MRPDDLSLLGLGAPWVLRLWLCPRRELDVVLSDLGKAQLLAPHLREWYQGFWHGHALGRIELIAISVLELLLLRAESYSRRLFWLQLKAGFGMPGKTVARTSTSRLRSATGMSLKLAIWR